MPLRSDFKRSSVSQSDPRKIHNAYLPSPPPPCGVHYILCILSILQFSRTLGAKIHITKSMSAERVPPAVAIMYQSGGTSVPEFSFLFLPIPLRSIFAFSAPPLQTVAYVFTFRAHGESSVYIQIYACNPAHTYGRKCLSLFC
jgi:hypothetical protein